MNEVKSQFSLVKGERKECQEVISALCRRMDPCRVYIATFTQAHQIPTHGSKNEILFERGARSSFPWILYWDYDMTEQKKKES